jgi:NADH:ubiquinone oxidoreductase subunit F (NADH-binding)
VGAPADRQAISLAFDKVNSRRMKEIISRHPQPRPGTVGVDHDETGGNPDSPGAINLEHGACLVARDLAVVLQVNYEYVDNQTVTSAEALVACVAARTAPQRWRSFDGSHHPLAGARLRPRTTRPWKGRRSSGRRSAESPGRLAAGPLRPRLKVTHLTIGGHVMTTDPLTPVLTQRWATPRSWSIETYEQLQGYQALRHALRAHPDQVIELVKDSGLRGRGGAGFPTGMKWAFIPQAATGAGAKPKYLVVNADESEPGTCKDIPLMMADPHALIEGSIITSYAIRANFCAIYIRGEALHCIRRVHHAVQQAYAAGYLGRDILGSGFDFDVVVHAGAGAYICGEETALLDSLEGRRGAPRLKPPFPATSGLYAAPTVVNNVETIATVPAIVRGGSDWFRSMGTDKSPGPKIYSLSGHVERPGQYEAPLGTTLRVLLELAGGMKDGTPLKFWTPADRPHRCSPRNTWTSHWTSRALPPPARCSAPPH